MNKAKIDKVLAHYGVPGMKWGVRKDDKRPVGVSVTTGPGGKIKTRGGRFQRPSQDAITAAKLKQRARKSSTRSLSNAEMQTMLKRMQLEKQYRDLQGDGYVKKGLNAVRTVLDVIGLGERVLSTIDKVKK